MRHRLGLATRTQISVCKSPFPSAGTAVSLVRAAADAFARFLDPGFVGGGAAASAGRTSCAGSLVTLQNLY